MLPQLRATAKGATSRRCASLACRPNRVITPGGRAKRGRVMLTGLRVVEFEGLGPAPFAGMMLAELGAEVVVVHRPGPGSPVTGTPSLLDRGKRSIVLDLKDEGDIAVARALATRADALIEGFRPG